MMEILKTVDALWLANPNNPTGNRVSRQSIPDLATTFPDKWFLIDEAFVQFLDDLLAHLLQNGIYIRDCRNFPDLEDNYFRLGLRLPHENDQLLKVMTEFGKNL